MEIKSETWEEEGSYSYIGQRDVVEAQGYPGATKNLEINEAGFITLSMDADGRQHSIGQQMSIDFLRLLKKRIDSMIAFQQEDGRFTFIENVMDDQSL